MFHLPVTHTYQNVGRVPPTPPPPDIDFVLLFNCIIRCIACTYKGLDSMVPKINAFVNFVFLSNDSSHVLIVNEKAHHSIRFNDLIRIILICLFSYGIIRKYFYRFI